VWVQPVSLGTESSSALATPLPEYTVLFVFCASKAPFIMGVTSYLELHLQSILCLMPGGR
jgi:hypothetical protein